jgi:hypothetical protein
MDLVVGSAVKTLAEWAQLVETENCGVTVSQNCVLDDVRRVRDGREV